MSRYTTVKRGAPKQTGMRQSARYPEDVAAGVRLGWLGALGVGRVPHGVGTAGPCAMLSGGPY